MTKGKKMKEPTEEQRSHMNESEDVDAIDKAEVAYYWEEDIKAYKDMHPDRVEYLKKEPLARALCQAVGVLLFVLVLGKLCGM